MSEWQANARMYAVTPEVETLWRELLTHIAAAAEVPVTYLPYPAPQPLENLWRRPDLAAVFMCGFPIALRLASVVPIAAPVPRAPWAQGRPVYRTDLIVRRDSRFQTFEDTFGGRAGFTVAHSHSGFNAFRHHLLGFRTATRPQLYSAMAENLVTARNVLESVRDGSIDVGPLDAYWHLLLAHHAPHLVADIRVLTSTATAPMPAFVASTAAPAHMVSQLRAAFGSAKLQPWFEKLAKPLLIEDFAAVDEAAYSVLLDWDRDAKAAGYDKPA